MFFTFFSYLVLAQLYSFILQLSQNIIQDIKGSVKDILKAQEEDKTRNIKDNSTEIEIEAKFTPLLDKISLLCNVAPKKESHTLPKKPKNTEIKR